MNKENNKKIWTIDELNSYLKDYLEGNYFLNNLKLQCEVLKVSKDKKGHYYFELKGKEASIKGTIWNSISQKISYIPKEGDSIIVKGNISLYIPRGEYSINIIDVENNDIGKLFLEFQKLKIELENKGYFDVTKKKKLPVFPKKIGIISALKSAALKDILESIEKRYTLAKIIVFPSIMQGESTKKDVCDQIYKINKNKSVDAIIISRGGGSFEELNSFNSIEIVEAIHNSKIPILTAIGHSTDTTLSELVSDAKAITPTEAANLIVPNKDEIGKTLDFFKIKIKSLFQKTFNDLKEHFLILQNEINKHNPYEKIKNSIEFINVNKKQLITNFINLCQYKSEQLTNLKKDLKNNINNLIKHKQNNFLVLCAYLDNLSPLKIMKKGYGMITSDKRIITSIKDIKLNQNLEINLQDGILNTTVTDKKEKKLC